MSHRNHGWKLIRMAAEVAEQGNENGAGAILETAARYLRASGLTNFADEVFEESCASCGAHIENGEGHYDRCPNEEASNEESERISKDLGEAGASG